MNHLTIMRTSELFVFGILLYTHPHRFMRRVIRVQKYSKTEHGFPLREEKSEKRTGMRVMISEEAY